MNKKWLVAMLGAAAMSVSAGAMAQQQQQTGFYVGADIGSVDFEDEDDTGFRFSGGYQFNRNFAAELGYVTLFDKSIFGANVEVDGFELVAVGKMPLANNFSVYGKLGFLMWDAKVAGFSDDGTDLTFGLGLQYDVSRNLGIRGQWQRYDVDDADADMFSVGLVYRF
jgi:OmpA-OmpF porin, OOP family